MIHNPSRTPNQCVGSASISASDKPSAGSASAGPSSTRADALQSASTSASPSHDAQTTDTTRRSVDVHRSRARAGAEGDPHPIFTDLARGDLSEGVAEYLAKLPGLPWSETSDDDPS